jgi:SAM-dependent methyltransferase
MKLTQEQITKLERFLERIAAETYPEPPTTLHSDLTRQMIGRVLEKCALPTGTKVLDVGCGQGVALEHFVARGYDAVGITLNRVDVEECQRKGYRVLEMDQSFLDFPDGEFDLVWCRHCLEHSIFPYFTLTELARVLKPGGWLYVEVPAPDTACRHQTNRNHYSVVGKSMLADLIKRCGFRIVEVLDIGFTVAAGPDTYWAFTQQKVSGLQPGATAST